MSDYERLTRPEDLVDCKVCNGAGTHLVNRIFDGFRIGLVEDCPCKRRRPCDILCRCSGGPL